MFSFIITTFKKSFLKQLKKKEVVNLMAGGDFSIPVEAA
jgi:hypothetical protein